MIQGRQMISVLAILLSAAVPSYVVPLCARADDPGRLTYSRYLNAGEQSELGRQYAAAEKNYRQALSEAQKLAGKSEIQESTARLATVLVLQNKLREAEPAFARAVAELKGSAPDNPEKLVWMDDLADAYILQSDKNEWELCLKHALQLLTLATPDQRKVAYTQEKLAQLLIVQKRFPEAQTLLQQAVPSLEKKRGVASNDATNARMILCQAYLEGGDYAKCETFGKHALDVAPSAGTSAHLYLAATHRYMARAYLKDKKPQQAERELLETIKIHEAQPQGVDDLIRDYKILCSIYLALNNADKAQMYGQKAFSLSQKPCGLSNADRIELLELVATACRRNHNLKQATEIDKSRQQLEKAKP